MKSYLSLRDLHQCDGFNVYLSPSVLTEYETQLYLGITNRIQYLHLFMSRNLKQSILISQTEDICFLPNNLVTGSVQNKKEDKQHTLCQSNSCANNQIADHVDMHDVSVQNIISVGNGDVSNIQDKIPINTIGDKSAVVGAPSDSGDVISVPVGAPSDSGDVISVPVGAPSDSGDVISVPVGTPSDSGDVISVPVGAPSDSGDVISVPVGAPSDSGDVISVPVGAPSDSGDGISAPVGAPSKGGDVVILPEPAEDWAVDCTPLADGDHQKAMASILESNARLFAKDAKRRSKEVVEENLQESSDMAVIEPITTERRKFTVHISNVKKLHVNNINYRTSQKKLWTFFSGFGEVDHCRIFVDHRRKSKGRGCVIFKNEETAALVLKVNEGEMILDKRTLLVEPFRERKYIDGPKVIQASTQTAQCDRVGSGTLRNKSAGCHSVDRSPISMLNDHIWHHIFSFLSLKEKLQAERVCKKWKQLGRDIWRRMEHLDLRNQVRRFGGCNDRHIRQLLKRGCPVLRSIDLSAASRHLSDSTLEAIGQHCPSIEHLDLSGMAITNKGLRVLAEKHPQLLSIHLRNCHDIGEKGIWWIFHKCKSLKELSFDNNHRIKGQCFHVAGSDVNTLSLNRCLQLKNEAIEKLTVQCSSLTVLDLSDCRAITNQGLHLLQNFQTLKVLKLAKYMCTNQVDTSGMLSVANLPSLEVLDVNLTHAVDDTVMCALGRRSKHLRELIVSNCCQVTDVGVAGVAGCQNLQVLKMSYLNNVFDGLSDIVQCCNLRELEVRGCTQISQQSVHDLAEYSYTLEMVDFSGCSQISQSELDIFTKVAREQPERHLTLILGGTDVALVDCELPSNLNATPQDFCNYSQLEDNDLALYMESDDSCDSDEVRAELYLAGDDPLYEEDFEFS